MGETRSSEGDPRPEAETRRATWRPIAFVAVGYLLLGRLSFAAALEHEIVTFVIFGAEGLSLAAAIHWGKRAAIGVFFGQWVLAASMGLPLVPSLGISIANAGECVVAAILAARLGLGPRLTTVRSVFTLFGLSAFVLQPLSASLALSVLVATGRLATSSVGATWLAWWLGNFIGQCVVAPVFLAIVSSPRSKLVRPTIAAVVVSAVGAGAFGLLGAEGVPTFALAIALYLPLLLVVSVWLGVEASAFATLASSLVAVVATAAGLGPFASSWLELDLFLVGTTFMALATSAAFEERRALEATLWRRNLELVETNHGLEAALHEVKTLRGLVPICASCKSIRLPDGDWKQLEEVLASETGATFTHGMCADCAERLYGYRKEGSGASRRIVRDSDPDVGAARVAVTSGEHLLAASAKSADSGTD